jgi:hypothetical protein
MPKAGVVVGPYGERFYTEDVIATMLGIPKKYVAKLVASGYLPPPEIRFGSKRVWPEHVVVRLQREARQGGGWAPFR